MLAGMGFQLANLQYTAAATEAESLRIILPMLAEARTAGAEMIALPECATRITADRKALMAEAETEAASRSLASLTDAAVQHGCWLLIGSLILRSEEDPGRLANRSFLISPDGRCQARYDKIHMFDANIRDGQEYRESHSYRAGEQGCSCTDPVRLYRHDNLL